MRVRKAIKKIAALGVGATMMGATILGATAADLSDYPNFFLDNGVFDGLIVVRGDADSLAAVDIASNMFYAGGGSTSTTTSVQGDAWEVGTSSKKLEMANNNATGSSIRGESLRDINTFIGDEELDALGDSVWATNEQDYDYQQFLFFDEGARTSRIVKYDESDDDATADFFFVQNSHQIARYKVEFNTVAESDITDSSGTADTTGAFLDDFEDTEITFWGQTYNVVQAKRITPTDSNPNAKLVLMAGPVRDTLLEGESSTYDLDTEEYTVELNFVDADEAVFLVNGEKTNKLKEGETYTLSNKKEIGVSEILYQDYAGGVHSATFYLGAQKMELRDDNLGNTVSSHDLRIGSEDIDGAAVIIQGSNTSSTLSISTIEVNMTAEDDLWVAAGTTLSEAIEAAGEEGEALFGGAWDVDYKGLTGEDTHDIRLKSSSSRRYKLQLYDGDGNSVDVPVAYAEAEFNLSFGEDSNIDTSRTNQKQLIVNESQKIWKDDYFIVTGGTAADGSAKSYLLQYKSGDRQTKTSPKIKFKKHGSSSGDLEYSVTSVSGAAAQETVATIKIGGYSFIVLNASVTTADDFQILVDLNGGGAVAEATVDFVDSYGSVWDIQTFFHTTAIGDAQRGVNNATHPQDFITISQSTPNTDDYDNVIPSNVVMNITSSSDPEVRATVAGVTLVTPDGETEISYGYTSMGTFIEHEEPSSDPDEVTLTYPEDQRLPQLFVTSGVTQATTVATGGSAARVAIPLAATKLPEEVTDVAAQNVISVGGPCANSVTADAMYTQQGLDVPANCAEGFNEGEAVVALFDVGDNVAMVVAGYSGDDTRRAGKVIASRAAELSGSQVVVQGTTASNAEIVKVS